MSEVDLFTIETQQTDRGLLLALHGDLDLTHASKIAAAVDGNVQAGSTLTVDLTHLRFLDSTGIRELVALNLRAADEGWALEIIRGRDEVHRVFVLCGLEQHLPFVS
jgi:anti-anti-sigma factor